MSRESIIKSIKKLKAEIIPLPNIELDFFSEEIDIVDTFKKNVQLVGGNLVEITHLNGVDEELKKLYPLAKKIITNIEGSALGNVSISGETIPNTLDDIDLVVLKGELGVAENGAVWISDKDFSIRVLPFITNDLVLVVSKQDVCIHMHKAFEILAERNRTFGVFIAGPSKTADIEQCLVIGAQGAMSLSVFLIDN